MGITTLRRYVLAQPLLGWVVSIAALAVAGWSWLRFVPAAAAQNWWFMGTITLLLLIGFVVADIFPIHIEYHTKAAITSIPLYLMAVLLPPPVAALAAGLGRIISEILERKKRGSLPSDIATGAGRWVLVTWLGSWIAHLPVSNTGQLALALFGTAAVMFIGDTLTVVFEIAPLSNDPLTRIIVGVTREGFVIEATQYILGILAALAALHQTWALVLLVIPIGIVYQAFKHAKEMRDSTQQLLERMADAVDLRDPYTGGHSRRVTELCVGILRELSLTGPDANLIVTAARVHDIGKIGIPDAILLKPDTLTAQEFKIMASHAELGAELLARYQDFARGAEIVRHHHERWDGQGYPSGLKAQAIPLGARIIAVADAFDAMTSDRPYRHGMSVHAAAQILRNGRAEQWDPQIVEAFLRSIADRIANAEMEQSSAPPEAELRLATAP